MPLAAFDLDGTLVDQAGAARAWATEFATRWALSEAEADRTAQALAASRPKGELFAELARGWSLPISGDEIWASYRARMPKLVHCREADMATLGALRTAGWTVGIITNGMTDNQDGKIRNTGLAEIVDGWVISDEVGSRKPASAIFHALADKLDCPLDGWMIGDSLELDVAGGAGVGLKTAWITGSPQKAGTDVTITAPSVDEAVRQILALQ